MRLIIVSILLVFSHLQSLYAQEKQKKEAAIDSFLRAKKICREDTGKVIIINAIAALYLQDNPAYGLNTYRESYSLAQKLNWKKGSIGALLGIERCYKALYSDSAIDYAYKALKIATETFDYSSIARCNQEIGSFLQFNKKYKEALSYYFKSLTSYSALRDTQQMCNLNIYIATVYRAQKLHDSAIYFFQQAGKLFEAQKNTIEQGMIKRNIGLIYCMKGNNAIARQYILEAIDLHRQAGSLSDLANDYANIADMYSGEKNFDSCISFYLKAVPLLQQDKNNFASAMLFRTLASVFLDLYDSSSNSQEAAYLRKIGGRKTCLNRADKYIKYSIRIFEEDHDLSPLSKCLLLASRIYEANGDFQNAMVSIRRYYAIKDSVATSENIQKLSDMETQRSMELKNKQLEINRLAVRESKLINRFYLAGIIFISILTISIYAGYRQKNNDNKVINKERKRSDDLLLNILPKEVAEELKDTGKARACHYDQVTVLFTDFVGFTKVSERLSPQELVDELDICFSEFDRIISRYNIEKIKTIGDAYMAVAGLPKYTTRHAMDVAQAAIEIKDFMIARAVKLGDRTFGIRIGIHTGSIVAGIVGTKKFAYDVWGDTVNTAARMEQKSEPGKINISSATYQIIKDRYICHYRGEIDAKNKGLLKMYFIEGQLQCQTELIARKNFSPPSNT